jgi:ABC-type lipoprotein export system ATPase subunit
MIRDLSERVGVTVVVATHERRFAEACDRIFRVSQGVVSEVARG